MILTEIEIGPHFLTLYSPQKKECTRAARRAYDWFIKARPELAGIQQEGFIHCTDDPNVYHPFGHPDNFKFDYHHFHIRYGYTPKVSDIAGIRNALDRLDIVEDPNLVITMLENDRLPGYEHVQYPEPTGDYLAYIDELRTGDWIKEQLKDTE